MSRFDMTTLQFDSLLDAAEYAKKAKRVGSNDSSKTATATRSWDDNLGLQKTLNHLTDGYIWEKGLATMISGMEITDELAARSSLPQIMNHVVGGSLNVGRYLTGHPRNMRRREKMPATDRPVLSIGIPLGMASGVSTTERLNFGAAMLSAVDQLERSGYRCEIVTLWRITGCGSEDYSKYINIEMTAKQAHERWNPAALAFALAHPAMLRRLCFKLAESEQAWDQTCNAGYGYNTNDKWLKRSLAGDFDIYFDNMDYGISQACNSPKGAFKYVEGIINDQLHVAKEAAG